MNSSLESTNNFTWNYTEASIPVNFHPVTTSLKLVVPSSAMIGNLSVQTVSFILLGVGAAAPIFFIMILAVALKLRKIRRKRHYFSYVLDHEDNGREAWNDGKQLKMRRQGPARHQEELQVKTNPLPRLASDRSLGSAANNGVDDTIMRYFESTVSHSAHRLSTEATIENSKTSFSHSNSNTRSPEQTVDSSPDPASPSTHETLLNVKDLVTLPSKSTLYKDDKSTISSQSKPTASRLYLDELMVNGESSNPCSFRDSGVRTSLQTTDIDDPAHLRQCSDSSCFSETCEMAFMADESGSNPTSSPLDRSVVSDLRSSRDLDPQSKNTMFSIDPNSKTSASSNCHQSVEEGVDEVETEEEQVLRCLDKILLEYT